MLKNCFFGIIAEYAQDRTVKVNIYFVEPGA